MILNGLKLNEEITELLLLSSLYRPNPSFGIFFGGEVIQPSSSVRIRNLGVILDPSVDMEDHIKKDMQDMSLPFN